MPILCCAFLGLHGHIVVAIRGSEGCCRCWTAILTCFELRKDERENLWKKHLTTKYANERKSFQTSISGPFRSFDFVLWKKHLTLGEGWPWVWKRGVLENKCGHIPLLSDLNTWLSTNLPSFTCAHPLLCLFGTPWAHCRCHTWKWRMLSLLDSYTHMLGIEKRWTRKSLKEAPHHQICEWTKIISNVHFRTVSFIRFCALKEAPHHSHTITWIFQLVAALREVASWIAEIEIR